jgi:hypothetical protein
MPDTSTPADSYAAFQRRWRRGIFRAALALVLAGAGFVGLRLAIEVPTMPWARSFGLWPTLTGDWRGEMNMPDGRRAPVFLSLWASHTFKRCQDCSSMDGRARVCDSGGVVREYVVRGWPDDWRGTKFRLSFTHAGDREGGLGPGTFQGDWSGDTIRGESDLVRYYGPGEAATATASEARGESGRAASPRVQYSFARGTEREFDAACRR